MSRMDCARSVWGVFGLLVVLGISVCDVFGSAQRKRHITAEDCVSTKRVVDQEVQVSPDGTQAAYIVKTPDAATNQNNYQLYLRNLTQLGHRENGRRLFEALSLSAIRWLGADRLVVRAETKSGNAGTLRSEVVIIHVPSGAKGRLTVPDSMVDYSISSDGETLVYSSRAKREASPAEIEKQEKRDAYGYRVPYGEGPGKTEEDERRFELYLTQRASDHTAAFKKLHFNGPAISGRQSWLWNVGKLNLSPDGKHLLLCHSVENLPEGWNNQPLINQLRGIGSLRLLQVLSLYDIASGQLRLAFNYPGFHCQTTWAEDSQAYSVVTASAFDTPESKIETAAAVAFGNVYFYLYRFNHVFVVNAKTGKTTLALRRDTGEPGNPLFAKDGPLAWKRHDGEMIVQADERSVARLRVENQEWKEIGRFNIETAGQAKSSMASDGRVVVGVSQSPMVPPDLFVLDLRTNHQTLVTDLNPEFQQMQLGQVEEIEWTNRFGSKAIGNLIKPVGYEPGKRYPLVFLGTYSGDQFVSDAYPATTAYAPQLLADAGFLVVLCHYPRDNKIPPSQYPGDMGAAFNWMAMVEGAVDLLANRGIADRDDVGLAGFSRTSWLTDFTLTHSTYKFVAASSADSSLYTYTGYYRYNFLAQIKGDENQVGGPPYGDTFKNWLNYAAPFNAGHVQAAVLMEFTGPIENAYEFFIALARQGKPAELYHYPNGGHPLDTPLERLASLQRNVDWFRFWMQGYERPNPEDTDQYTRWHLMKAQWEANRQIQRQQ